MPNPIKYTTGSETLALKKGNFYIGTGDVGKGPTSSTGYYNGITPPSGGYTIYLNKESGGPSIYTASNDAQLISLTNSIAGQSYTSSTQCFNYYYGQTDKVLVNQDYPPSFPYIVMDGLVLYLDAGITQSYTGSGTVWTDINGLGPKNNGTLINGPTFNSDNGGSIVFDGSDDRVSFGQNNANNSNSNSIFWTSSLTEFSIDVVFKLTNNSIQQTIYRVDNWTRSTLIVNTSNNLVFTIGYDTPVDTLVSNNTLQTNTFYYVSCVFKKTLEQKIYLNGNLNSLRTPTVTGNYGGSTNYQGDFNIGRGHSEPFAEYMNGSVFLFRWYNRALSASEVLQNYNAQKGRFGL